MRDSKGIMIVLPMMACKSSIEMLSIVCGSIALSCSCADKLWKDLWNAIAKEIVTV